MSDSSQICDKNLQNLHKIVDFQSLSVFEVFCLFYYNFDNGLIIWAVIKRNSKIYKVAKQHRSLSSGCFKINEQFTTDTPNSAFWLKQ
jgi:hypothetical protein